MNHIISLRSLRRIGAAFAIALLAAGRLDAQVTVVSATLDERPARPGETYTGTIRVRNAGGAPQDVKIHQTDYRFFADGRSLYDAPGSHARSNAAWVTFSPASLTLGPHEEATVRYEIRVPADPALRGTYWSVVMVEGQAPPARTGSRGVGITPVVRYAVQLATHLDGGESRVALQAPRLGTQAGAGSLSVDLANTGDRASRVDVRVDLFDAQGNPAGSVRAERGLMYPGTSVRQSFELGRLAPGAYRAIVIADTGGDEVFGAEYTLRL